MTDQDKYGIDDIMRLSPVIPVLTINSAGQAWPLAQALCEGGLKVVEVTLRTAAALGAITEMAQMNDLVVGAGTVLNPRDLDASLKAGARFIVSPGLTTSLARAAATYDVPFLPGIATAGDIMRGLDLGLNRFKFFPAEAAGGIATLRALAAPFRDCRFCPTGGITAATAPAWLALESVLCVGGSWLHDGETAQFDAVRARAREAGALRLT